MHGMKWSSTVCLISGNRREGFSTEWLSNLNVYNMMKVKNNVRFWMIVIVLLVCDFHCFYGQTKRPTISQDCAWHIWWFSHAEATQEYAFDEAGDVEPTDGDKKRKREDEEVIRRD